MNTERKSRRQFGGAILRIYKWMGWVGFLQALWQIQSKSQGLTMITKKIKTSIWRTCLELEFLLFPCWPVCKVKERRWQLHVTQLCKHLMREKEVKGKTSKV